MSMYKPGDKVRIIREYYKHPEWKKLSKCVRKMIDELHMEEFIIYGICTYFIDNVDCIAVDKADFMLPLFLLEPTGKDKVTNGDKIRQMTDEELDVAIRDAHNWMIKQFWEQSDKTASDILLAWLQKEAD